MGHCKPNRLGILTNVYRYERILLQSLIAWGNLITWMQYRRPRAHWVAKAGASSQKRRQQPLGRTARSVAALGDRTSIHAACASVRTAGARPGIVPAGRTSSPRSSHRRRANPPHSRSRSTINPNKLNELPKVKTISRSLHLRRQVCCRRKMRGPTA